ncbi:MAG TPA: YbaK/EbsC family protein [Burkholderiaceae bacterium]|nr:YbaK/EbsC family protein [Burkholderiaceae bacterium]
MKPATHRTALRVQGALGPRFEVMEFEASTRSAAEAAAAIGCTVGQIAKSLVFRATISDRVVLVITSGTNRVSESIIATHLGEKIERANADFVRERTGFAIGGVPPIGHSEPMFIVIDEDLRSFDEIWAAAGTPNAVFRLTFDDLVQLTNGRVTTVALS